jgi:hypothetical protein
MSDLDINQFAPPKEHRFYGPAAVCGTLSITPGQLAVLMEAAGVRFARIIDHVPYVDGNGFDAIAAKCRDVRKEIHDVLESAEHN